LLYHQDQAGQLAERARETWRRWKTTATKWAWKAGHAVRPLDHYQLHEPSL
jgi:hypothetical protein